MVIFCVTSASLAINFIYHCCFSQKKKMKIFTREFEENRKICVLFCVVELYLKSEAFERELQTNRHRNVLIIGYYYYSYSNRKYRTKRRFSARVRIMICKCTALKIQFTKKKKKSNKKSFYTFGAINALTYKINRNMYACFRLFRAK